MMHETSQQLLVLQNSKSPIKVHHNYRHHHHYRHRYHFRRDTYQTTTQLAFLFIKALTKPFDEAKRSSSATTGAWP
jgi:hypothetical protein